MGETYLSLEQAVKVCLPEAAQIEERELVYSPEQAARLEKLSGVKPEENRKKIFVGKANGKVTGYVIPDQVIGKHDLIDYAVALDPDGKVRQVEILEYRENYGGEIRGAQWRTQFAGKDSGSKLKLFEDVTNISGATLSCKHVTDGVRKCLAIYEIFLKR